MFKGLSFLGKQVVVFYNAYLGQPGRIRALDRTGLWIIELDESDEYGPIVLALEAQAFRLA